MGPLGLSGSLFLGLLVLDFYHPTNRDLYLVGGWVGGWVGGITSKNFYVTKSRFFFIFF